jgi:hypothetical protein
MSNRTYARLRVRNATAEWGSPAVYLAPEMCADVAAIQTMVAYASRGTEVRPGDVLGSGTCGGGCLAELWGRNGLDAHPPLRPGDLVTVSASNSWAP